MTTLFYSHPDFLLHDTGPGHPECPDRLISIQQALEAPEFASLLRPSPPLASEQQIQLIHPSSQISKIRRSLPKNGFHYLDADTVISRFSVQAAMRAVGAACDAVDQILSGAADNAFCAVRPPGHHAEPNRAMGFCLFNTIAIAAEYARQRHHLAKVAIVDFDVHHGNGTQAAFYHQPDVLYASSHQMPHYPGTGMPSETGAGNIFNVPLFAGDSGGEFRKKYQTLIFPALHQFKPDLLLISAGFDAHRDDPLASIDLIEDDYRWLTEQLMAIADQWCRGKLISVLEGGYHLTALATSAAAHIKALMNQPA